MVEPWERLAATKLSFRKMRNCFSNMGRGKPLLQVEGNLGTSSGNKA
jgi:hypothetical protein